MAAGKKLAKEGINATVVNNAFINNPDVDTLGSLIEKTGGKSGTYKRK